MSTNRQVITQCLRMIGVLDANESAQIEDAELGLAELNDLMAQLAADSIDLGFPPQDNLSEDFPLDATTESNIKPMLAMKLLVHYPSARPGDMLGLIADNCRQALTRAAVIENMEESSIPIPLGSAWGYYYDIESGE